MIHEEISICTLAPPETGTLKIVDSSAPLLQIPQSSRSGQMLLHN